VHTVTKVLVVFASILCVLLAALTMAYSVNVGRIVDDRNAEINRRLAADALASQSIAMGKEETARLMQDIQARDSQVNQLGATISQLQSERAKLTQDLSTAVAARDAIVNQIDQAVATSKTQALLIQQYRDEVTQLRTNELAYNHRQIELSDRINDLESNLEVQQQSVRALQEQLVEARRTIDAGGSIGLGSAGGVTTFKPSIPISAKSVQTTKDAATGKPIATINLGTNNQIREGMLLAIVRGNEFLGNLTITKTDLQWAQGEINYLGRKVEAKNGDSVTSLVSR
jgi:hypothetical protein